MHAGLVGLCAGLLLGAGGGYLYARLGVPPRTSPSADESAFRHDVEDYAPSCEQLRRTGLHGPYDRHGTRLYVQTRDDDYHVAALRFSTDRPPAAWWWGARRANALKQACGHDGK
jgi:hypothetical protein